MQCRLINTKSNSPEMNMAIDEALLDSSLPVLRFYSWFPPGLSLGYFQKTKEINKQFCKKNNIHIVRRITGGNAVLHEHELTYSFIIDESLMPKSVTESYKKISLGIISALKSLGINAKMNDEVEKGRKSAVCFNDPSWYEIIAKNKKLVGSAQKRINGKLLQHGAILLDIDLEKYAGCFENYNNLNKNIQNNKNNNNNKLNKKIIQTLKNRITSINELSKNKLTYNQLAEALKKGFEKELNLKFIESTLSKKEISVANSLCKAKYLKDKWNYSR